MKCRKINLVNVEDFNDFIIAVYGKPFSFQQQGSRPSNGVEEAVFVTVPYTKEFKDFDDGEYLEEQISHAERILQYGVKFSEWLNKDSNYKWYVNKSKNDLIWERYYYPCIYMLMNDLYNKNLIEAGEYCIKMY